MRIAIYIVGTVVLIGGGYYLYTLLSGSSSTKSPNKGKEKKTANDKEEDKPDIPPARSANDVEENLEDQDAEMVEMPDPQEIDSLDMADSKSIGTKGGSMPDDAVAKVVEKSNPDLLSDISEAKVGSKGNNNSSKPRVDFKAGGTIDTGGGGIDVDNPDPLRNIGGG